MSHSPQAHDGAVQLGITFDAAYAELQKRGIANADTADGTPFEAHARGARDGRRRYVYFTRDGRNRARCYECCWGRYHNCHRTRIGMYCVALVAALQ